ncbi:neuraminidase-like domain-containing protein [Micromonospora sp. NPDC005206]|uniref:Tc toxin subunit A-related protein n=1 Tax=Micromonospora sp. NPDC005206 TaxID=3157022 RepID=UPI0033B7A71D
MPPIRITSSTPDRHELATLHAGLGRLRITVDPDEQAAGNLGDSTRAAIREFQRAAGLPASGELTSETLDRLNRDLSHRYFTDSKTRAAKIQDLLARSGHQIDPAETKSRRFGDSTRAAYADYLRGAGLATDTTLSPELVDRLEGDALKARLSTRTQVGQIHRTLLSAIRIGKLELRIDPVELREKRLGETSKAAIVAFQRKYRLRPTGELDPLTLRRMETVATSRPKPVAKLTVEVADDLTPVTRNLRLNMTNKHVGKLQKSLAFLGLPIDEKEFKTATFGASTRTAVIAFQKSNQIPVTGHVEGETLRRLNAKIAGANPQAVSEALPARIRGSVRDELWRGRAGLRVQLWEKLIRGTGALLGERPTTSSGFYDIPYTPPLDPATKQWKLPYHVLVKVVDRANAVLDQKVLFNPTTIAWVNFVEGGQPYRGTSEFEQRLTAVTAAAHPVGLLNLEETDSVQDITHVSVNTGLGVNDVMRMVVAARVAAEIDTPPVDTAAVYAFIRQNLPPSLPSDLLQSTQQWTLVDQVVERVANGLVFLDPALQLEAFDNAVRENYIPISIGTGRDGILAALAAARETYVLEKPILIGDGNLKTLLDASSIDPARYPAVADAFLTHKTLGADFFADARSRPADFGGLPAIDDLETTVSLGEVTKNFSTMAGRLKAIIDDPADNRANSPRDFAKLGHAEWVQLITDGGGAVPPGTDGTNAAEKVANYAATLAAQTERLYPTVAFVAEAGRGVNTQLTHLAEVQQFVDAEPDFDLRTSRIDAYAATHHVAVDDAVSGELKVLQRVRRIAPDASLGRVLLDQGIHSALQVLNMGKERIVTTLAPAGIDERTALTVYGVAEFQYGQAVNRLVAYRTELNRTTPKAIVAHTYTAAELEEFSGGVPNLETLFGSMDVCDCPDCLSVLGPPAYLADMLRFLEEQPSQIAGETVRKQLFKRRPDLGNLRLNCDNTTVALPYIDLVNEVLEALVPPGDPAIGHQTTRTQEELRAFPENEDKAVYDKLAGADFPMHSAFNLWQEEARVFLDHLGLPRHELMRRFQAAAGPKPTDVSIAGESLGISTRETDLITTARATDADQKLYWGLTAIPATIPVADFLERAKITYPELLRLCDVEFVNPAGGGHSVIERPASTYSLREQRLTNLTTAKLDKLHRFLRLWRHTPWQMSELDLLIRAAKIGNKNLDGDTLVRLSRVRELQSRLRINAETVLAMYGELPTRDRKVPEEQQKVIRSAYSRLFRNPTITNPVDAAFDLPIAAGPLLADHRPALVAALGVSDVDLTPLLGRTDGALTVANLSTLVGYAALASGLGMRAPDLVTMLKLVGIDDPFATVAGTLDAISEAEAIAAGGVSVEALDHLLNARPESAYGLRDEVIAEQIAAVRESLRSNPAADPRGQVIAGVAAALALTDGQAAVLLDGLVDDAGPIIGRFLDPDLTVSAPLLRSYRRLHKAGILLTLHGMSDPAEITWFLSNGAAVGALSPADLPVDTAPATSLYERWLALHRLLRFRDEHAAPEGTSLTAVLDLARNQASAGSAVLDELCALTGWDREDLADLHTGLGFTHGLTSSYRSVETYRRLAECFQALRRVGVPATQLLAWADRDTANAQFTTARQVRQATKAHYTTRAWLTVATPLVDGLREKKRDALTAWLVENSLRTAAPAITVDGRQWPNPMRWKDADDLLAWVLIDVQMSSCQLTSRTKQAIGSTQMFVQRCFLNLEQAFVQVSRAALADTVSLDSWKQWRWMKNYRVWEANRKVFLYPENWIEPELRDDKSPFFTELENELLQADITDAAAEAALRHYLEKVHEVARLEVTGVYYEVDDDNPYDNLPPNINRLHVLGRTKADPAVYFYRQYDLNYGTWSPWERIDVEIGGDHAIPVVYNRDLYVFWLVFTEKPQKPRKQPAAKPSDTPQNTPDPSTQLELQLAWTTHKDDGWTAKKLSRERLLHPWQRPLHSYNLRPRYRSQENMLWLDIFISTSVEFNGTRFTDAYTGQKQRLTATVYDEAGRPWHSSSFLFNGNVAGTRMKGLSGQYHLKDANGNVSDNLTATDSHTWVSTTFGAQGAAIGRAAGGRETMPRTILPAGMHFENTRLRNNTRVSNPNVLNVLEGTGSIALLRGARAPFDLVFSQHGLQFDEAVRFPPPMIYQDPQRSFLIKPYWRTVLMGYNKTLQRLQYEFTPFYHPYSAIFLRELQRSGLDGLLNRRIQVSPQSYHPGNGYRFTEYAPATPAQARPAAASDVVDFDLGGAYSVYNWEIFFHAPLMAAVKLTQNQRFEEAMRWFHFIFDPTSTDGVDSPQRFWITRPFYEQNDEQYRRQRIEELLKDIGANLDQLRAWKNNPFKPHLIARYRPVAYQKTVVMRYIDNLIAWGDQLFRRDTIESINEATTLYLLAWEILGPRPVTVPDVTRSDKSYNELTAEGALDPFGNQKIEILMENFADSPVQVIRTDEGAETMPVLEISYFGIPQNNDLLGYWDLVADRLWKIRNCMNIRGIVRQLPLFEPPIDPAVLVQAAAAGVDLDTVLGGGGAPSSQYRSRVLIQKALEYTQDVHSLGERLLAAIEKGDAEALDLIRASNEVRLLDAGLDIKRLQVKEAEQNQVALERSRETAEGRIEYYGSRDYINLWEGTALTLSGISTLAQTAIALGYALAGGLAFIPKFTIGASGFGGSPVAAADIPDGIKFSKAAECAVSTISAIAGAADKWASMATTMGGYQRRAEEWEFQKGQAGLEVNQLLAQIEAAKVRVAIAETDLAGQETQIEQARGIEDYLRTKYTNRQLYDWMLRQVSTVYFQGYQLAFDMAKRAEQAMRYEFGDDTFSFVQFGYWDGLKKGLLAGERLTNDLRRMEAAWLERNTRTFEISKNVSLAQVDPLALLTLKTTGTCHVKLPEWLYDLDYPGHLRRRITSVSISVPCVVGPYTSVNCTLSLTNNGVRVKDGTAGGYGDPLAPADDRFATHAVPTTSIATSHAQNDSGMFELSFNDDRFLPFEGAGAVSEWTIDLPPEHNQFDFNTISDVILHVRYKAEPGSTGLVDAARTNLATVVPKSGMRLFVLNREFAGEWQRFLSPQPGKDQELVVMLERKHLPFRARGARGVKITRLDLIVDSAHPDNYDVSVDFAGPAPAATHLMSRLGGPTEAHHLIVDPVAPPQDILGPLTIKIRRTGVPNFHSLPADDLTEAYLVVAFTTS